MKTLKMTLLSLTALAFFLIPLEALANRPVVRVQVRPSAPRVHVSTRLSHRCGNEIRPIRSYKAKKRYSLTIQDRWMAKTLAYETGIPKRWLLDDRKSGYSWVKIGHKWGVSRRMVRSVLAESRRIHQRPRMERCLTSR